MSDHLVVTGGATSDEIWARGFEAFVERHSARFVQTLSMISLDREVAADAAQEAFLQLYLRWDQATAYRDTTAWLYRVGINRCKDYRRHLARTARVFARIGHTSEDDPDPAPWAPEDEFVGMVRSLPARQRTAAALFYLADLSVAEIAAAMHISEGAVNSHLHRARESLRGTLEAR